MPSTTIKSATEPEGVWNFETILAHLNSKIDSLRELLDERDSRYNERNASSEKAITAALTAVKENTSSSFAASEKAIVKAEDAQREYNIRSNEFRGQLDDQAKTLMPRPEALTMFKAADDKFSSLKAEVQAIREAASNRIGNDTGKAAVWATIAALVGAGGGAGLLSLLRH